MKVKPALALLLPIFAISSGWHDTALANPCDSGGIPVQLHQLPPGIGGTGNPMQPGVGGTGRNAEPGLGGTGRALEPGVGGTGSALKSVNGDAFVYGVITGFASICVNGVEIEYENSTPVSSNGEATSVQALKVGQWVAVKATGQGREVNAKSISIEQPIGGPVTRVDAAAKTIDVMGQAVRLNPGQAMRQMPKVGDSVAVSGFRLPDGSIQSSRIDPMSPAAPAFVKGELGNNKLLNVAIDTPANLPRPASSAVKATGRWDGARLKVTDLRDTSDAVELKPGTRFHVQAFVGADGKTIQSAGREIPGLRADSVELKGSAGKVAVVRGNIDSAGRARVESVETLDLEKMLDRGGRRDRSENRSGEDAEKATERAEKDAKDLQRDLNRIEEERIEQAQEQLERQQKAARDSNRDVAKDLERQQKRERNDRMDRQDSRESKEARDRPERRDRNERAEKIERPDRKERTERPERSERPDRAERIERPERPEYRD